MRLLSLELHGFKSFPDKTLLKFAPGVTTVVGPNGSGKSNISDAVRWVLGEISSKSMRGSKMDDVIFSGSDTRKPMNYAEVSITLDNREENGFSRMPIDYDEVTITRRINRNGGSDYFINRQAARLKDINSLFMNTGIGRDGYSIVSQGKAAEIISQKSDERRNVFEEAAGISKYRYQKNEAEKKLEAVSANCEIVSVKLAEQKKSVERLEKDSERAKRYLEIYEKKKEADISIAVYDVHDIISKLTDVEEKYDTARRALTTADNNIADTEAERDRIDLLRTQTKELYAKLSTQIEELNDSRYKKDTNAQLLKNEVAHMTKRISEYTSALEELENQLNEHTELVRTASEKLNNATNKKNETETLRETINSTLDSLRTSLDECDLKLEQTLTDIDTIKADRAKAELSIAELDGTSRSSELRKIEITEELKRSEASVTDCSEKLKSHKAKMDSYNSQSEQIKEKEKENSDKISELRKKLSELNERISSLASDLRDIRTRTENLRRMEELFEGYPHSVSAIMGAVKVGKLSGIFGPLSHIFTVDSKYAVPIETALASTLQNIVCENEEAAKAAIEWLKINNAGRTTFYPINTMQVTPLNIDEKSLKNYRGYIGIASELISYDSKFERVIKNLLGRTLVFDNLNNATALAKATGYRARIVTLDGQQINAGGSFTGGSKKKDTGILNRTAEIDKLNADKIKIETEKTETQKEYDAATRSLNELLSSSDNVATKLNLLNTLYQAEMQQYSAYEAQMNTIAESQENLRRQLTEIDSSEDLTSKRKNQLKSTIEACKTRLEELNSELTKFNEKKSSLLASVSEQTDALNTNAVTIAELNRDVENASHDLEYKTAQYNTCQNNISETQNAIATLEKNITETQEQITESSDKVAEISEELTKATLAREKTNIDSIEYEQKLSNLNLELQEQMRARALLSNDYTKLEGQKNNLVSERDRILNYITDEYSITFTEAEELNYPPVTAQNRHELNQQLTELKYKLRGLGSVDPSSIDEYKKAKQEYDTLNLNYEDLCKSRESYTEIVNGFEQDMRNRFIEVIGEINEAFQRSFSELFGGGKAEVVLTDMDDVLHCGIDINVAPPGKIIKNLSLLSGGEQAFISIALVFALLHVNPSPFCIFDEIEAALDEVNVAMFANYIKKYSDKTQFITITHRRGTMEVGDTLYGVTMAERGISRVLTLNVNEVENKLGVKI